MSKFKELNLSPELIRAIEEMGIKEPTEIQEMSIPFVLAGKDVIAQSSTGSGKTLAFGSAIAERVEQHRGVQALVLTPTRELAEQVAVAIKKFVKYKGLLVKEVYGGVGMSAQIDSFAKVEIIVGTPGRILDHLKRGNLNLSYLKILVLDEADRMVDMGFIQDIKEIIRRCPEKRQTLLFSATISSTIDHIAKQNMIHPKYIAAEEMVEPSKLKQYYYDVPQNEKFSLLVHLLEKEHSGLVMVFSNTRHNADFIADNLNKNGFEAMVIHGGLEQNKRSKIMEAFHSGKALILVCTDVAARGLDIKNVSHIYNYDIPNTATEYIHRIGRTARAGKEGIAINIVSRMDYENFRKIYGNHDLEIASLKLPELRPVRIFTSTRRRFKDQSSYRPGKHRPVDRYMKRQMGHRR